MNSMHSCLHPNPGWTDGGLSKESSQNRLLGKHCILELYDCDESKLNDEDFIRTTIKIASKHSGATLLKLITHRFYPQGVTGLALLAESHISIHTWPESLYAAVDVFTCGDHTIPGSAASYMYTALGATSHETETYTRPLE